MSEFLHQVVKKREDPCTFMWGCLCNSCARFIHMWDGIGDPWNDIPVLNPTTTIEAI